MRAIRVAHTGGPDQLQLVDIDEPEPGPTEVVVSVEAAGVNFIDTYQRTGLYPMATPYIPGLEGAGAIMSVGSKVTSRRVGDRVAWCSSIGSYAERVAVPADRVVEVPAGTSTTTAAAVMLQGLTAHYLHTDTFALGEGHRCLIHAGAGGVGRLLIQMAKRVGAEVFTTVGSELKAELVRAAGADHVITYRDVDFADVVRTIAGDRPLDVVYDGVGRSVFDASLGLLRARGMMVTFGNASGPVEPVAPLVLSQHGSLYLTRPTLFDYVATPAELRTRATSLFALVAGGLDVQIDEQIPLAEAARAHQRIEGRHSAGKLLLLP